MLPYVWIWKTLKLAKLAKQSLIKSILTLRHAHVSGQIFYKFNCDLNIFLIWLGGLSLQILLCIVLWKNKLKKKKKPEQTKCMWIFSSINRIRSSCIWPDTHTFCIKKFSYYVSWYIGSSKYWKPNEHSHYQTVQHSFGHGIAFWKTTIYKFDWYEYNICPLLHLIFLLFLFHFWYSIKEKKLSAFYSGR